jgi:hypothetical protein
MSTVYMIEEYVPLDAIWMPPERRGQWVRPRFGPRAIYDRLPSARAALTRYRRGAGTYYGREYRIVEMTGDWQAIDDGR